MERSGEEIVEVQYKKYNEKYETSLKFLNDHRM